MVAREAPSQKGGRVGRAAVGNSLGGYPWPQDVGNRPTIYPPPRLQPGGTRFGECRRRLLPCPATSRKGPDRSRGLDWSVVFWKQDAGGTAV